MKVRAHVFISGRVQGVFFRSETRRHALRLGMKGWIRNLLDGRVEAVFEGEHDAVKRLLEFCRRGSSGAKVTNVETIWEDYKDEFNSFEIRFRY